MLKFFANNPIVNIRYISIFIQFESLRCLIVLCLLYNRVLTVDIGLVGFNLGSSKGTFAIHCQFSSGQFLVHFFGVSGHRWPQNLKIVDNKLYFLTSEKKLHGTKCFKMLLSYWKHFDMKNETVEIFF